MMLANFERDGIRFAFERRSTGRPMVLLHGLGGDRSGGFDLADTRLRWQRLALDQRGHGDTEPVGPETGYSFEVFASDVLALLDNEDVNAAVVVGVSMGSAVALRLALDHPRRVKGLALVRPAWTHEPLTENLVPNIEVAGLLRSMPPADALAAFRSSRTYGQIRGVSRHAAESLCSQFLRPRAVERSVRLFQMPRCTPYTDPDQLATVQQPTVVIGCDRDPLHPIEIARTWARLIPTASLESVSSSADDISRHRREVRAVVDALLDRVDSIQAQESEQ